MPLSADSPSRIRKHSRGVRIEGYARADGRWDIGAHLTDVKPNGYRHAPRVRPAGSPLHDVWVRLTEQKPAPNDAD